MIPIEAITTLAMHTILETLRGYACTDAAKQRISELRPFLRERDVLRATNETTQARQVLDRCGNPPLTSMKGLREQLELAEKGGMLLPEQLAQIAQFLSACRRLQTYFQKADSLQNEIAGYAAPLDPLPLLQEEIERSIRGSQVDSEASKELKTIRRKLENTDGEIREKLGAILRSKKEFFSDNFISVRNGHFVLPVKKEYKQRVAGAVIGASSTGSTVFIEPSAAARLQEKRAALEISETNEVHRILYTLSSLVCDFLPAFMLNFETIETLDYLFAKAKLSRELEAVPAQINTEARIRIQNGRHPLLERSNCVPLQFELGGKTRGVVITGPNTGGKTVALKTVGLLCMMAQCGLHIPCESADICLTTEILCDIGDGQSISENLSTFSAHITNIIAILGRTGPECLVLLDELGSGTDPAEGMGIAIAILEELCRKNCLFIATTHYPEVKDYAARTAGMVNARMAFDRESLRPLYRLEIGEAGESCALYIAKRLGLPAPMLETAWRAAYCSERGTRPPAPDKSLLEGAAPAAETSVPAAKIEKQRPKRELPARAAAFSVGDSVTVHPQEQIGIVYRTANERGEIGVQLRGQKQLVPYKRLTLKVAASELYPEDYDFSIVFDSVATRKARHQMDRKFTPGLEIQLEDGPK